MVKKGCCPFFFTRTMTRKERYERFMAYFQVAMPEANTELQYENAFQLLCAVMLSAQCTDKRVNMVTPALFEAYPTPLAMSVASLLMTTNTIRGQTETTLRDRASLARLLFLPFDASIGVSVSYLGGSLYPHTGQGKPWDVSLIFGVDF